MEYIIYSDESAKKGEYFSNFYGGVLVRSPDLAAVVRRIRAVKEEAGLGAEAKWAKVSKSYLERYKLLMDVFFRLVAEGRAKVRIMFTQNVWVAQNLEQHHRQNEYHILYYHFLKLAFGLRFSNETRRPISLRVYLDKLPGPQAANAQFKSFVSALQDSPEFEQAKIRVPLSQVAEVDSRDHQVMQCLDVVLGAMQFRLNNKHLVKPPGKRVRGKKTRAKEALYKHIRELICQIRPRFNVGDTTGKDGDWTNLWQHPYRHWKFVPREAEPDWKRAKP